MSDRPWAVILGVSSGTGAAIARRIAADPGFHLYGIHRGNHQEAADQLTRDVAAAGSHAEIVRGDASTPASAAAGAAHLLATAGPRSVRLLAHCLADASLGSFVAGPGAPLHPKQFEKTFVTMAHSLVFWTQEMFANDLLAPGASIVGFANPFVDSVCGGFGMVAAAKAALEAYVRYLAFELGPKGIRVNLLKFGLVETPAVRRAFSDAAWARTVERVGAASPYGRICTVEEIARFVSHLVHEDSGWFNGATIDFTGGQAQSMLHYVFHHR